MNIIRDKKVLNVILQELLAEIRSKMKCKILFDIPDYSILTCISINESLSLSLNAIFISIFVVYQKVSF